MKTLTKIIVMALCSVAVVGFAVYEAYSIVTKEYVRQAEIATEARTEVNLGLDMIRIAVQTNDTELYGKNLEVVREGKAKIEPLFLVQDEQAEYMTLLNEYMGVLESKAEVLAEMGDLKAKVTKIEVVLKEKYGNKDEISRDKVKAAKEEVGSLKIDVGGYKSESVVAVANAVNETLDMVAGKVGELGDCIDNCYKDKIKSVADELAEAFKGFSDKVPELNARLEAEFEFGKMDELLQK